MSRSDADVVSAASATKEGQVMRLVIGCLAVVVCMEERGYSVK
jgi:hypothetical protein